MPLHTNLPLSTLIAQLEETLPSLVRQTRVPALSLALVCAARIVSYGVARLALNGLIQTSQRLLKLFSRRHP